MIDELQTWANWAQIVSLVIAVLSFTASILMWIWRDPSEFVQRIRPWAMRILIG